MVKCAGYACSFTTSDPLVFTAHLMMMHTGVDDFADCCIFCFQGFVHPVFLTKHIIERHHDLLFQCNYCLSRFSGMVDAKKHSMVR